MTDLTARDRIARIVDPPCWENMEPNIGPYNDARTRRIDRQVARRRASERKADRVLAELGWRPIESCPKTGEPVLLFAEKLIDGSDCCGWIPHDLEISVGWWSEYQGFVTTACNEGSADTEGYSSPVQEEVFPTHWMPLPSAPEAES